MKLHIKNFRSVENQDLELAPITLIYGPNGAGKSSLLYTLLALKNVVLNPNQNPSGFFNFSFVSLGSFEAVVFNHQLQGTIELGIAFEKTEAAIYYQVDIGEKTGSFSLTLKRSDPKINLKLSLPVSFPYQLNQNVNQTVVVNDSNLAVNWNGVTAQVQGSPPTEASQGLATELAGWLNSPIELLRRVGTVPLKRGFSKPHYSSVPVSPLLVTEDEIATSLSTDKYLVSKLSVYLESILQRDFRLNFQPGSAVFSLDATDKKTGIACELVNDGFGVNQLVYFLARCLHRETEWICVEEPEIHLHPSAARGLALALGRIMREEGKRFLISTHSEPFVLSFLTMVSKGELMPTDLACYLARKENRRTILEREEVNQDGQVQGGLASFMTGELEDIKTFLHVKG